MPFRASIGLGMLLVVKILKDKWYVVTKMLSLLFLGDLHRHTLRVHVIPY